MSELEDLLYRAHEEGFYKKLMKKVSEIKKLPENKWIELYDLYSKAHELISKED